MRKTREELEQMCIRDLRDFATIVGVQSPTSKKHSVIIKEILEIYSGKRQPAPPSRRGRPRKKREGNLVNNAVYNYNYLTTCQLSSCSDSSEKGIEEEIVGVVDISSDGTYVLVPTVTNRRQYMIDKQLVLKLSLKCGDLIRCKLNVSENSCFIVEVITINGLPLDDAERVSSDEYEVDDKVEVNVDSNLLVNNILPVYQGERMLVVGECYQDLLIGSYHIVSNIAKKKDVDVYLLMLNTTKEHIKVFSGLENINVFASQFGDSVEVQGNLIRLCFDSVLAAASTVNKNIMLIVQDVEQLLNIYSEQYDEKYAISKIKNIFMKAKKTNNSSLTIMFSTLKNSLIHNQFAEASNINLYTLASENQSTSDIKFDLLNSCRNDLMHNMNNKLVSTVKRFLNAPNYMEKHKELEKMVLNYKSCQEIYQKLLEIL